jgi:hypothetical protein
MFFGGGFAPYMSLEIGPSTFSGPSTNANAFRHNWFPGAYIDVPEVH